MVVGVAETGAAVETEAQRGLTKVLDVWEKPESDHWGEKRERRDFRKGRRRQEISGLEMSLSIAIVGLGFAAKRTAAPKLEKNRIRIKKAKEEEGNFVNNCNFPGLKRKYREI